MPITHTDGATYYSKDEVEGAVKDRIKNVQTELAAAEAKYKQAEPALAELNTVKGERDQLKNGLAKAEGGLKRFQAAAAIGITDNDTLWALEQAHERAMSSVPEANRAPFEQWLPQLKADPNLAPTYLRPMFATPAAPAPGAPAPGTPAPGGGAPAPTPGAPAPGAPAPAPGAPAPARPAWAPSVSGQVQVNGGATPKFADQVRGAKTLEELAALDAQRRAAR